MTLSSLVPIYARSCRKTRLCMRRTKWRYGKIYVYEPRKDLIRNVAREFGWSEPKVRAEIQRERFWLLANPWFPLDLKKGE
ncbi:hypothetical protein [Synechocystis salina]|uniref:hypothetical protein n=1 Tax=Synechocystis salina TaxID=945780 RepID=UPI00188117C0|nr:hypothetical protein [Synechocystis salina]